MVFQGEFDHSVDDKGRVIIPTKIRSTLGDRFYMTKGLSNCIFVYTEAEYRKLSEKLNDRPQLDQHTMRLQRFFTATELGVDSQGRVAIPSKLRDWAKIGEQADVVIVGAGSRIEIWSKTLWEAYNEELTDEMIAESARQVELAV